MCRIHSFTFDILFEKAGDKLFSATGHLLQKPVDDLFFRLFLGKSQGH